MSDCLGVDAIVGCKHCYSKVVYISGLFGIAVTVYCLCCLWNVPQVQVRSVRNVRSEGVQVDYAKGSASWSVCISWRGMASGLACLCADNGPQGVSCAFTHMQRLCFVTALCGALGLFLYLYCAFVMRAWGMLGCLYGHCGTRTV